MPCAGRRCWDSEGQGQAGFADGLPGSPAYPHRLADAIAAYGLQSKVQNSHRALDDVLATVAVLEAMEAERPDLREYANLFGFNARYGLGGKPIGSVRYKPQGYEPDVPLYRK